MERDWGSSKTGSVLRPTYYPPARARIKTRPVDFRSFGRPMQPGALSSLRGNLGSFYERSLWKRASCARDKPAVPTYAECVHIHSHESIREHTHTRTHAHTHTHTHTHNARARAHSKAVHHIGTPTKSTQVRCRVQTYREREVSRIDTNHTYTYKIASYNYKGILHRICMCIARAVPLGWSRCAKNFRLRSHENVDWSIAMWATRDAETLPLNLSAFTPFARVCEVQLNKPRFLNHKNTTVFRNVFAKWYRCMMMIDVNDKYNHKQDRCNLYL